jgi:hypothetical protein
MAYDRYMMHAKAICIRCFEMYILTPVYVLFGLYFLSYVGFGIWRSELSQAIGLN